MRIRVKSVTGEEVEVSVADDGLVAELKAALVAARAEWQPSSRLRIACNGAMLDDAAPLADAVNTGGRFIVVVGSAPPVTPQAPPADVLPAVPPPSLDELFSLASPAALGVLLKLASNVLGAPDEAKFRRVRRGNQMVAGKVLCHAKGEVWLAALGFEAAPASAGGVEAADEDIPLVTTISAAALRPVHAALTRAVDGARPSRVCVAKGWVVHGLCIELGDGSRCGAFLENDGSRMDLTDDAGLARRGGAWHEAEAGERLVAVRGRNSAMGYLCGEVHLVLSSGRTLPIVGENASVFGASFEYAVPPLDELADILFADGKCVGITLRSEALQRQAAATQSANPQGAKSPPPPPAELERPRVLHSVAQLHSWAAARATEAPRPRAPTAPTTALPKRPRALACHDCRGGYNPLADDEYLNCFRGWEAVDVFVYFGHHRVSMPPRVWVEACHARSLPCLGTLIVEGDAPSEVGALLGDVDASVEKLCALCDHFGFDGWLVNLEAAVPGGAAGMGAVHELLELLTVCLKQRVGEQALVLVYDSLDRTGRVRYQNSLAPDNKAAFDACDGLFTNYWWGAKQLAQSVALAGARRCDVYVGVDCFARNTPYAAGPACAPACAAARAAGLSLALFAPGWSIECGGAQCASEDADAAAAADRRFWEALGLKRLYRD